MSDQEFLPGSYGLKPENGTLKWRSPSNIALIKYWGKYGEQLPKNASLSFTLSESVTETTVFFEKTTTGVFEFEVYLDGSRTKAFEPKILQFFERIEAYTPFLKDYRFRIETSNSFPHSSGIASSASGFSALALCLLSLENELRTDKMLGQYFNRKASFLARLGSGSACRSIHGPLVVWGEHPAITGSSDYYGSEFPYELHSVFNNYQDTILLVDKGEKQVSSSAGHGLMNDHPYAASRFETAAVNLDKLKRALISGDLVTFIEIVESEALQLHAMMMASIPYFILMRPNTLEIISRIWKFRKETNKSICFTLDAGANVHVLYPESEKQAIMTFIKAELLQYCKNGDFIVDHAGPGASQL